MLEAIRSPSRVNSGRSAPKKIMLKYPAKYLNHFSLPFAFGSNAKSDTRMSQVFGGMLYANCFWLGAFDQPRCPPVFSLRRFG